MSTAQAPRDATQDATIDIQRIEYAQRAFRELAGEIKKVFVGQDALVRGTIIGLLTRGNILLEGPPGLGKTMLVKVLSEALQLKFSRIQFTPDLMPADITGTEALVQRDGGGTDLAFRPGPVFAHIVLADEINRATPKTQSALLEAMQEHAVTVAGVRRTLEEPFFVIATQNPIEMEGTYSLPEAQLDRFLLKLDVPFPSFDELRDIGTLTTGKAMPEVKSVMSRETLLALQDLVREVVVAPQTADIAAHLTIATHPEHKDSPELVKKFVRYGASPRAMQALLLAGRAAALLDGRAWVGADDLYGVALPILRHRMILSFDAELDGVGAERLVNEVIAAVKRRVSA
jgi:MoxR-like ATPase